MSDRPWTIWVSPIYFFGTAYVEHRATIEFAICYYSQLVSTHDLPFVGLVVAVELDLLAHS